jgi:hypothetical protein
MVRFAPQRKGDKMLKSFRVIGVSAVFLVLGWNVPAGARQGKQEEKAEPARQEQRAKPEKQQQTRAPQQERQAKAPQQQHAKLVGQQQTKAPQQQAKPERQQQAKAPQQQQQPKPEKQQQVKGQQNQQHSPRQQQVNSAIQQPQQARGQQQQRSQQQGASSQRPQRTQQAEAAQRAQPKLRLSARGSGRIPDARFQASFGRGHEFHMGNPVMVGGYSRFQYGGFWFGFVQPWPVGWYYTDDVYIDYVDGGYYIYDPYYPGARFAISVVL